ncbi:MAG: o-succinylbenzoate synthase [Bacteroidetes bacterium]|nr:o-succinylbenzoate synthase [Bacteroidota bacterium]
MIVECKAFSIEFLKPAKTSRGEYALKNGWLIGLSENGITGTGEASPLPDLSVDGREDFEQVTASWAGENLCAAEWIERAKPYPALQFAIECAWLDWKQGGRGLLYPSAFTRGETHIPINGLVWMDDIESMYASALLKIQAGFRCLKFKVGALDHDAECRLLEKIRKEKNPFSLEIRLDANGAYTADTAPEILKDFQRFGIHSIEQPIRAGQAEAMAKLCADSALPIALDEELIGRDPEKVAVLLKTIKPAFIILKPTLLGGFTAADQWIAAAEKQNIGWWATSALESNIGLGAIAQWVATKKNPLHQGLGTGSLYKTNFEATTYLQGEKLWYTSAAQ